MASLNYKSGDEWKKVAGGKTGVLTFNGRAGVVTPKEGDYSAEMVGARPNTWMPNIAEVGGVNPNLLDNWYFANPVNQRGLTIYEAGQKAHVYTIDRWWLDTWYRILTIVTGGISLSVSVDGGCSLCQLVEGLEQLDGMTVTLSVMVNGTVRSKTGVLERGSFSVGSGSEGNVGLSWSADFNCYNVYMYTSNPDNVFQAIKLELGSTQTLAHQDTDGNWVLNEIPDYGEELQKCRRYYRQSFEGSDPTGKYGWCVFTAGSNNGGVAVSWEDPMRASPTVTVYDSSGVEGAVKSWDGSQNPTGIYSHYYSPYGFALCGVGAFTKGNTYHFHYTASADL